MDFSPLRRRRARPACSWHSRRQKAVLCACACLALGASAIVPTEAWIPAARPLRSSVGRGGGVTLSLAASGRSAIPPRTLHGAFSDRPKIESRFDDRFRPWGVSAVASRASRGRPAGPVMLMAEEEGGAESIERNAALGALTVAGLGALYYALHDHAGGAPPGSFDMVVETAKAGPSAATTAIQTLLTNSVARVEELGPLGPLYFAALYVVAEVLAIPAIPLTTAAGFLFGVTGGTAVVLASATVAAAISFQLGRTLLRQQVEGLLEDNPKFRAIDKAIGKQGFKIMLLLRLSPIFPFALSNYLYGVTSVDFWEYMAGTMLGFFPGTLAYVYGGTLGKAITDGGGMVLPWYGYLGGAAVVAFLLKTLGDIATSAIEDMEPGMRDE